jgi:two-component system LytT family sensor kinase
MLMTEWTAQLESIIQHFNATEGWVNGELIYAMFQRVSVMFFIAFLFSKSKAFELLIKNSMRKRDWFALYAIFAVISIIGSVLGDLVTIQAENNTWTQVKIIDVEPAVFAEELPPSELQANIQVESRAIGAVLAGFLGGPLLGLTVGASSGFYRYLMGGDAAIGGAFGTALAGLIAGFVYLIVLKTHPEQRFNWKLVFITTCLGEIVMKVLVIISNAPLAKGIALIQITTVPNILGNGIGAALFITILSDYDRIGKTFSIHAIKMAERFARVFKRKLPIELTAKFIAKTLQGETGAAAVAMTKNHELLAFVGIASDHHLLGDEIATELIHKAIETKKTIYLDGYEDYFHCKSDDNCPLHSALIIPVIVKGKAEGTILLFDPKHTFFPKISRELGTSLAKLLSEQILASRYHDQLIDTRLKHLHAKVDSHFLSNSSNMIISIIRKDKDEAIDLLKQLAYLMRERLNPENESHTLTHEIELLNSYICIEKARFKDRLLFTIDVDKVVGDVLIPGFILQLLVENAIKHGTSQLLPPAMGQINVRAYCSRDSALVNIEVSDNAGLYSEEEKNDAQKKGSYGIKMIDELIRTQFNSNQYGLKFECEVDKYTKAILTLPRYFDAN